MLTYFLGQYKLCGQFQPKPSLQVTLQALASLRENWVALPTHWAAGIKRKVVHEWSVNSQGLYPLICPPGSFQKSSKSLRPEGKDLEHTSNLKCTQNTEITSEHLCPKYPRAAGKRWCILAHSFKRLGRRLVGTLRLCRTSLWLWRVGVVAVPLMADRKHSAQERHWASVQCPKASAQWPCSA